MAYNGFTDARRKANAEYLAKQDKIQLRVQRGAKPEMQAAAAAQGQSLNGYIIEAIRRRMEKGD